MERYNEEELLYLSRQGCSYAREVLYELCLQYVSIIICKMNYNFYPLDKEDVAQEAFFSCLKALDKYRNDMECLLKTYLARVIKNKILSMLKKDYREKDRIYKYATYLDANISHTSQLRYDEVVADRSIEYCPQKQLLIKEEQENYQNALQICGSKFEKAVMEYRLQGYSEKDIAIILSVNVKKIYNAMYRLQKKLVKMKSI